MVYYLTVCQTKGTIENAVQSNNKFSGICLFTTPIRCKFISYYISLQWFTVIGKIAPIQMAGYIHTSVFH
jgi:hypothetical protein